MDSWASPTSGELAVTSMRFSLKTSFTEFDLSEESSETRRTVSSSASRAMTTRSLLSPGITWR